MRHFLLAAAAALTLAACGKNPDAASAPAAQASAPAQAAPTLLIAPEDVRTVGTADAATGPVITGSIQPERRADLRAEVSAVVLQVLKENGEAVRAGDLLVKLDDTSLRDSLASAEESARAAGQAFEQAERQVQRLKTLQAQGMTSMQALEDAEVRRNAAQSELAAAKARVVAARQQLQRTLVRAPFDGVVSDRKVSAGDTAQVGKELVKVIDPRSMRFEGSVSSDRMHQIRPGQDVSFRVNGFPDVRFAGKVKRVDASADPMTRQVEVLVAFADPAAAPRVAGLYAEGRIAAGSQAQALTLPEGAIQRQDGKAYVWRLQDKTVQKVAVQLGQRDARSGEYPVKGGLAEGDRILRNPGSTLVDGQKIELAGGTATAAASSAAMR
ncbi:MAG: efflux RND transporter periplasmic adaptor subunit [Pseudomonadota bacterium]